MVNPRGESFIRLWGADNDGKEYFDFDDWNSIADPTELGNWNVICVHWDSRLDSASSLWVNFGIQRKRAKMSSYASTTVDKSTPHVNTIIGNAENETEKKYLNSGLKNIEIYNSNESTDEFIRAYMNYLC